MWLLECALIKRLEKRASQPLPLKLLDLTQGAVLRVSD